MAETLANTPVATRHRVKPSTILKLVVTLGLTVLVLRQAGISAIAQTLVEADWRWAFAGLVLAALAMVINVCRWQLMLRGQGAQAPLMTLIRLYLVGMFFSNVLPSRMGGDVVRAYGVSLTATSKTRSAAAIVMDRLVGAISVLVLGMGAILLGSSNLPVIFQQVTVAFFGVSMVLLALMVYRNDSLADRRLKVLALSDVAIFGWRVRPLLESALNALRSYSRRPGVVIQGFLISLVANGCSMVNLYFYAQSVRAPVGLGDVATIAPFVLAIGLLPISINGIGTIELAFVVLFGTLGVDEHVAIAVAILRRLAQLVLSLLGGLLYAFRRFS